MKAGSEILGRQLFDAMERVNFDRTKSLLEQGADPNWRNPAIGSAYLGEVLLVQAAEIGWIQAIEILIAHGADVTAEDDFGHTALMYAARDDNLPMVRMLLAAGARPDVRNCDGYTVYDQVSLDSEGNASRPNGAEIRNELAAVDDRTFQRFIEEVKPRLRRYRQVIRARIDACPDEHLDGYAALAPEFADQVAARRMRQCVAPLASAGRRATAPVAL